MKEHKRYNIGILIGGVHTYFPKEHILGIAEAVGIRRWLSPPCPSERRGARLRCRLADSSSAQAAGRFRHPIRRA